MSVEIVEVLNRRDLKKFVKFPHTLYNDNQYWAPPLIKDELTILSRDKNPAFEFCTTKYWLAYRNGKIVGRIAGIINNRLNEKWKTSKARFGWIDFIDDEEVSKNLIDTVEKWTVENGLKELEGPMQFTDLDEEGMLIEGFEEQSTMATTYNYAYYPEHLGKLGYKKQTDWVEFELVAPKEIPERVVKLNSLILKRSKLRVLDAKKSKDYIPYIPQFWEIIDEAFSELFGTTDLTEKQKKFYTDQYFSMLIPDFTTFILDENDKLIGAGITFPSFTEALRKAKGNFIPFGAFHMLRALKNPKVLDFYLIGVRKEYQGRGVVSLMMNEITQNALRAGVQLCETNVELEDNTAVQGMWEYYEHRQHKRRRCFIKTL
ncbi:MAG: GNAT family N-acetyltransferase [Spirochaetales bacterium]|uniref:GNAT family N-acetyltransferase n=1 Tax=Candidatus Thalassospirochaeta sargassi TaxID=3119039 RepID=A0AAJ1MJW7_9SPIO|nr:GNAT family N-acetyltransferase [Spirochaetales bacterium]